MDTPRIKHNDQCEHEWRFIRDWYGDSNVINGTADCSFYRCDKCDTEQSEKPEDYEDAPDPDAARDEDKWNEECDREPDGECFRGNEAAAYTAEQQAWIQRNLK